MRLSSFTYHTPKYYSRCFPLLVCLLLSVALFAKQNNNVRNILSLNNNWRRASEKDKKISFENSERRIYDDQNWHVVNVPDNVNTYEGVQRYRHNDYHGDAWYRKTFVCPPVKNKRFFLFFEGVGSYATVWLNEKQVGYHAGGRTTFTLDVTDAIEPGKENLLVVKASQPAFIKDLPWVCGGCSDETGFSEGSQPTGIFRPVSLLITNNIKIAPFGVHIWNDSSASEASAALHFQTEIRNYFPAPAPVTVRQDVVDQSNKIVCSVNNQLIIPADSIVTVSQQMSSLANITLWNPDRPYLYKIITWVQRGDSVIDKEITEYGIRTISWPNAQHKQFLVNGKPVFINGTAEYEHLLGKSHAFANEEIMARIEQVKAAGFNAFRDAHQPHNLYYKQLIDNDGLLWWPQFAAHIWYDTPQFRNNFLSLLKDWVKERRNSPSIILWGLENESTLPADFAEECSSLIRSLDPTASVQRKITTCNGGAGTDWNVPQNWSGTYGGDTALYGKELMEEVLVGEYGAWRSLGLHAEEDTGKGIKLTENDMTSVLETKVRLGESVKDAAAGHFNWLLYSHENPGRVQSGESMKDIGRIGPVNYKGLFSLWGEPTDAFYMYRSNYVPAAEEPMVYIVSHQWADRWKQPSVKNNIIVYSNCDEVELFNDVNNRSLGKRTRNGIGTHFTWNDVNIQYNILYAIGYVKGKAVAKDIVVLNHLPQAPHEKSLFTTKGNDIIKPKKNLYYIYRVNCGGNQYKDEFGNVWQADIHQSSDSSYGYRSWADNYDQVPFDFASQRTTNDPVTGTNAWSLFQNFRYGLKDLQYSFPVENGEYEVELYFAEPWYGLANVNANGWRIFDISINDSIVENNVDLFAEKGYNTAVKKRYSVRVTNGAIHINFPNEKAGEAVVMAIAISGTSQHKIVAPSSPGIITNFLYNTSRQSSPANIQYWMNTGDTCFTDQPSTFSTLPASLFGAEWIQTSGNNSGFKRSFHFTVSQKADVYVAQQKANVLWDTGFSPTSSYLETNDRTGKRWQVYKKRFDRNEPVRLTSDQPFIIAVTEADELPSPFDLRKSVSYTVENALIKGENVTRANMFKKSSVTFNRNTGDTVIFSVPVGVAGMYAIKLRYRTNDNINAIVHTTIRSADGILIKEETAELPSYTKEKWGTWETNTGSYINAGTYTISIQTTQAAGLSIAALEIQ